MFESEAFFLVNDFHHMNSKANVTSRLYNFCKTLT